MAARGNTEYKAIRRVQAATVTPPPRFSCDFLLAMSRSAAQRDRRRLREQLRPTFPFTRLPAELQLLVRLQRSTQTEGRC